MKEMKKIELFKVYMKDTVSDAVSKVLKSGYVTQGKQVEAFEYELKKYLQQDFVVTTNSATSAEHLAIELLRKPAFPGVLYRGWQPGDEFLASPQTCTASNFPFILNGLKPKWVDIDPTSLNMDLDDLARKITDKTKIIQVVFWGGMPVNMNRLKEILDWAAKNMGIAPQVMFDGAHALGSTFEGQQICNFGALTTYSFQAIKHITCVDGGALVVPTNELYRRARLLRWYGIDRDANRKDFRCETNIDEIGTKWHMNDVNATIGMENLKDVEWIIGQHRSNAAFYQKELTGIPGVQLLDAPLDRTSSYWIYTIKVERRDDFMAKMKEKNIVVSRVHERNDIHSALSEFRTQLPTLDKVSKEFICIPNGWWVTEEDREYVVDCIKEGW